MNNNTKKALIYFLYLVGVVIVVYNIYFIGVLASKIDLLQLPQVNILDLTPKVYDLNETLGGLILSMAYSIINIIFAVFFIFYIKLKELEYGE